MKCYTFFLLLVIVDSNNAAGLSHHYVPQCHKPGLLPSSSSIHKNITDNTPKFVEYSCQLGSKRARCASKMPGMGNILQVFPAVYLMAMITGRELIILDGGGLGRVCQALKCGFDFTSKAEEIYPSLKMTRRVRSILPLDLTATIKSNMTIPEVVVGFRGVNTASNRWHLSAGSSAHDCVQRITGKVINIMIYII